ncbi:MAG: 4-(cytidine 5'-diphospho)-2-C-methyl-D-erythritol kinase [Planctomycetaceae bacterium]|nr:4-(cytidine 5'-diphospho)-2-C-methyl-D-erythritol kinase [Planctomycetaceae bacterium]
MEQERTEAATTAGKSRTCLVGNAPAKLNLFFEIHGKRPDGYHDVCSLCCPINVFDTLTFESHDSPEIVFTCEQDGDAGNPCDIPTGSENIVVRAVERIRTCYGIQNGCRIRLVKRIPSQAGMGGGSSDAATAIRMACKAWNLPLSQSEMSAVGAQLGSDVPLFFMDGPSLGSGRGELVAPVDLAARLDFVIVKPSEGISTAEAFRKCSADQITDRRTPERLLRGLRSGDFEEIASGMFNRLEATARQICPTIERMRDQFEKLDCPAHQMTGSGTAWFALCRSETQAHQLALPLRQAGIGSVFVAHSVTTAE